MPATPSSRRRTSGPSASWWRTWRSASSARAAPLKGETAAPHKDDKEDAARSKTELIALLKESTAYCDPVLTALKDDEMTSLVKSGPNQVAKGLFLAGTNTHGNEMYGTMAVYLRLKGIVPPTTERQNAAKKSQ
jgi:hypothetical protein